MLGCQMDELQHQLPRDLGELRFEGREFVAQCYNRGGSRNTMATNKTPNVMSKIAYPISKSCSANLGVP